MKQRSQERRQKNRLALVQRYMRYWAEQPRTNWALVCQLVEEQADAMGLLEAVIGTGVEFVSSEDPSKDMRTNGQKLWRWLGFSEEVKAQPGKILYLESAIVAAMPEDLRREYLSEVYCDAGLCVVIHQDEEADWSNPHEMIMKLIRRSSEAEQAVVALTPDCSQQVKRKALLKLMEAQGTIRAAIGSLVEQV